MSITINILSAMSIVMALFIPYFILLHLNNKLRKEVEGALNRVLELKVYSKMIDERLIQFSEISNVNFDSQDKNWENYDKTINLIQEALSLCNHQLKDVNKNLNIHIENTINGFRQHSQLHDKTITFMNIVEKRINQKTALKEILETPIEVKKQACETKVGLWSMGKVNANDIQTVTKIKNKFDFECGVLDFKKGYTFTKDDDFLTVHRYGKIYYKFPIKDDYTTVLWEKLLKVNQPEPKRKYTKRTIKNEN
jgi:hypothetical protein